MCACCTLTRERVQELESKEDAFRSKEDASARQEQLLRLLKIEVRICCCTHLFMKKNVPIISVYFLSKHPLPCLCAGWQKRKGNQETERGASSVVTFCSDARRFRSCGAVAQRRAGDMQWHINKPCCYLLFHLSLVVSVSIPFRCNNNFVPSVKVLIARQRP